MISHKPTNRLATYLQRRGSIKFLFLFSAISVFLLFFFYIQNDPRQRPYITQDLGQAIQDRIVAEQVPIIIEQDKPLIQDSQEELDDDEKQRLLEEKLSLDEEEQPLRIQNLPFNPDQVNLDVKQSEEKEEPPLLENYLLDEDLPVLDQEPIPKQEQTLAEEEEDPRLEPVETVSPIIEPLTVQKLTTKLQKEIIETNKSVLITSPVTQKLSSTTVKLPLVKINENNTQLINKTVTNSNETLKYILLWTTNASYPFHYFGEGQKAFLSNKNCTVKNCYVTTDRNYLNNDLTKFDAIVFNGRNVDSSDLPKNRSTLQKYIFVSTESADRFPVCDARYDDFYNWTATYRLNSDVALPYLIVKDDKGNVVGPKRDMKWLEVKDVGTYIDDVIANKSKAAAWYVSHCVTTSRRERFVEQLQKALKVHGHTVDVYGSCGTMECPRGNDSYCDYILERDYFFYMSLENSFDEDYVTEKLFRALNQKVVPIVYGGADYSRYLPPGSYINGRDYTVQELADLMYKLIKSPEEYSKYFWWKDHYTYYRPQMRDSVCSVCAALNSDKMAQVSRYPEFRKQWHPSFEERCKNKTTPL